jgi:hypothetical protein
LGNRIRSRKALYHTGSPGLVFRCKPAFFDSYRFPHCYGAISAALRVIAPGHLSLYQRDSVIIGISVVFRKDWRKRRCEFLDLNEELVLTGPKPREDG